MLTKLALGSAQLGSNYGIANKTGQPSQNEATKIIHCAIASGIKIIDTARAYGNSEEVIGHALHGIDRSGVNISTKLSPALFENTNSEQEICNNIDQSIKSSLQALNTTSLDILMLHRWSHFSEKNSIVWKRLLYWKNKEIIKKLGVSLSSPIEAITALNQPEIEFIQIPFNILDWRFRCAELRNAIIKRPDVTIQTRSAFLQGILISPAATWPKNLGVDATAIINQLEKLVVDFKRKNRADLCTAYLRSLSWIDNIVIGMETLIQLNDNIKLFQEPLLHKEQIEIIEKTFVILPEVLLNPSLWNKTI